ncbi:MAG: 3-methyl-2-oxobutanoate hydroxymethyltransferase [Candidatus Methylacidiphilales bacterium]|nr:3-methyl-2-oxobutanoate hydroxymethyltransferase [Candidatus Methylacidiphilales bacterium]
MTDSPSQKITPESLAEWKAARRKIPTLTAYDYPTARLLDEAGIPFLLVGDSLGMVVLGFKDTTQVTMDHIVHHLRAVSRGVTAAMVVADLPFESYETDAQAVTNARRLADAGADAVKLEGGSDMAPRVRAIRGEGIAVVGHIGMLPQHIREEGGYKIKGRLEAERTRLLNDALAIEAAGACAIVMELVVPDLSAEISRRLRIPTIGIGSGEECDGQILVTTDLLGTFPWFKPKFVKTKHNLAGQMTEIVHSYMASVQGHVEEHS